MNEYKIDSHKLMYHPKRVTEWLEGKVIAPIYVEISPTRGCNHRCKFCAFDYLEYKPYHLETKRLISCLNEMKEIDIKSIMYGGEGEPLLHKDIKEIIKTTKNLGMDTSLTTNGVLLTSDVTDEIISSLSWIKISVDAGNKKTYSEIHRTKSSDFEKVIENLRYFVDTKKENELDCTIGIQLLLLPENKDEICELAILSRNIGVDYLVVKPFSQHLYSKNDEYRNIDYSHFHALEQKLKRFEQKDFKIVFRYESMMKQKRSYKNCYAIPFWTYIDSLGNVCACSAYLDNPDFNFGNIYSESFSDICNSKRRQNIIHRIENMKIESCRENCRMDKINSYLWDLKHPSEHVNFI